MLSGPQAKQDGNGWFTRPLYDDSTARASSTDTGSIRASVSAPSSVASATTPSGPVSVAEPSPEVRTRSVSSGGGRRSVTCAVPGSSAAPSKPAV